MNEQHASTKIVSWNMNGGVSHRIPLNEELCWRGNILCIQEHLLTSDSLSLLKFSDNHTFYFVPAKSRQRGRPSGGLAIVCSSAVDSESLHTAENFMFIRAGNLVIVNVYLPTNYSNDESDNRFSKAVRALAECLNTIMLSKLECVIIGDYNCDLADDSSPWSQLILSILENRYCVLPKDNDFTFIHTSGSVSNIDHVACTLNVSGTVSVLIGSHSTDHIPIEASVNVCIPKEKSSSQWYEIKDWLKADFPLYQTVLDKTLQKINVPYNLLQANVQRNIQETKIQVNNFCVKSPMHY